jgi:hypothetical protein
LNACSGRALAKQFCLVAQHYLLRRLSPRRRVNCEGVPLLPARIVQLVLDDPRKIPYLLVWRSPWDRTVKEAVRIDQERSQLPPFDLTGWVEIKRPDGTRSVFRSVERALPRNGGKVRLLACPACGHPRRALYGWRPGGPYTTSVERSPRWECRVCAGLRYSSEGGALLHRSRSAFMRLIEQQFGAFRSPRPDPWYPDVLSSP